MNFGAFLDNNSGDGGNGGAKIVADIPYSDTTNNNTNMPTSAIAQQRLISHQPLAKSMFSSPGLSLALVKIPFCIIIVIFHYYC